MKKHWKKCLALSLSLLMAFGAPVAVLTSQMSFGAERPATVKATSLNIRSGPGTTNASVGKLSYGAAVTVLGEAAGSDGSLWYQIRYTASNGQSATGYVSSSYIQFPTSTNSSDAAFEAYLDAQGFPESYRPALRELHGRYPQWVFTAMDTGLDWNEVIQNESLVGRNLVSSSSISSWKSTAAGAYDWGTGKWPGFDGSAWVAASEDIIRYYMDPRNFINETYIFQFLSQSYDAASHTKEGLLALVQGTFLEGSVSVSGTYTGGTGTAGSKGSSSSGSTGGDLYGPGYGNTAGNTSGSKDTGSEVVVGVPPGGKAPEKGSPGGSAGTSSSGNTGTSSGSGAGPGGSGSTGSAFGNGAGPGSSSGTSSSDVSVGVPPGKEMSLSSSPHEARRAGATVIRVGPGGETASPGGAATESTGTASYVDILMQAAKESGVSPYVLASMILQEQGIKGESESISGAGGYYNFYNFEAYASNGMTAVQRGLWYASQSGSYMRPWDSVEKSIIGGACQYGQNYVNAGQDTFYLKKFNVQGSNLYKHQYMTNVEAAAAEGAKMGTAYPSSMRQIPLRFKIPVYRNMPAQASAKPVLDGSPNNKLSSISVDGFTMTPSFDRDTESYNVTVNSSVTSVVLRASVADAAAQMSGTGTVSLTGTVTEAKIYVTAQNGSVRTYTVRITRSGSGPQNNGSVGGGSTGAPADGTAIGTPGGSSTSGSQGQSSGNFSAGPGGSGASLQSGNTGTPGGSNVTIVY